MTLEEVRERGLSSQIDFTALIPEHLRPGRHTLQFDPVEAATRGRVRSTTDAFGSPCRGGPEPEYPLVAGFDNFTLDDPSDLSGCSVRKVWQVAARFNLDQLREVRASGPYFPTDAILGYREEPFLGGPAPGYPETDGPPSFLYHEQDPDGGRHRTLTCRLRLARPTVSWSGRGDLLPYEGGREPRERGRWTGLLGDVQDMLIDPESEQRGFVLLAFTEDMNEDNGVCKSKIEDLALFYTYATPER